MIFFKVATTRYSNEGTIEDSLTKADVVIGAVLVPGANAPCLVTRMILSLMQHRAVLVDVAIDQGGCFETSKPTTHKIAFLVDDIIHYCVANMPGAGLTSSYALNNATPFGLALARHGYKAFEMTPFGDGLNIQAGRIVNPTVADSLGFG